MDEKKIIEDRIASIKKWRDRSINQITVAAYDRDIEALEKEMEKPVKKSKKKGDKK